MAMGTMTTDRQTHKGKFRRCGGGEVVKARPKPRLSAEGPRPHEFAGDINVSQVILGAVGPCLEEVDADRR